MQQIDLTEGKVIKILLALALPIMGSSFLQFTYSLVDMLWIGHLGSNAVASIGSSSFFINLGYALNALIMIGTGIKVSHYMGKADVKGVKGYIHSGIVLSAIIGIGYAFILLLLGKVFIGFLGLNDQQVEQDAYKYLAWSAPMLFFSFFNNVFLRVFTSLGNSKSAFKISAAGVLLNIGLDPLFIYSLKGGIVGAALATLIAQGVMFGLYLVIGKDFLLFNWKKPVNFNKMKEIITLGSPIAFQRILFTLINIILAKMIATFGTDAVAAQRIGIQVESIIYMVTGGLNGAVASFIGQNYGAGKGKRLYKGYQMAMGIGIVYAAVSSLVFIFFSEQLAGLFVKEGNTITIAVSYLKVIAYSQLFNAMEMVANGFFTGLGKPNIPATISIIFTALRLPMAYIGIRYLGIEGIWWSITLSTFLKGSLLVGIAMPVIKTIKMNQ
ncbi:MATE family efflux transporter [Sporanaerobium hydrogeniformans]|uniref:MATE family efflux transporter n=1 Tax=Sporanaerobium hydrogeniformans TaxID=3072179 RepID=A0AC61DGQ3_9FIRM|nr:MATE family efflux transporter [Sporanaerobium hydrogeniformans]PHV72053.1 MATE family efflux transporter [Sporanaerobium hydrogeniformans]